MNSLDLYKFLNKNITLKTKTWWPNYGTFEVIVGAILTQQTKWQNVENSILNLKNHSLLNLEKIANLDIEILANLIKPSGFYNQKSKRLKLLCSAILRDFGDFETFKNEVSRDWLIYQKGIGFESCDSILCYACEKDIMVVDSYTMRLLGFLGYDFQTYDEAQEWLMDIEISEYIFQSYHGLIVEFCKEHFFRGKFDDFARQNLHNLL